MKVSSWGTIDFLQLDKRCRKLPASVLKKYDLWKNLVFRHGPDVLKTFPGFHDEKLKGERAGQRSSRLSLQYRVIYRVDDREFLVCVLDITPHQY